MEPQTFPYMICEGLDDPWVSAVPSLWFDGKNCWWPPKCRDKKRLKKFMDLGYLPDQTTWKSYPAKMRKQYMTFEEAMQHETKAVDNPSGDIESTDSEKEKRSRGIRKTKLPFDPSSSPVSQIKSKTKRRIQPMSDSEEEIELPRPPTPPSSGLSTTTRAVGFTLKNPASSNRPGSAVHSNGLLASDKEETFTSRSTPPTDTRALASTSKYHATSNRPGSTVRSNNLSDLGDKDPFPFCSLPPNSTNALASSSKNTVSKNRPSSVIRSNDLLTSCEETSEDETVLNSSPRTTSSRTESSASQNSSFSNRPGYVVRSNEWLGSDEDESARFPRNSSSRVEASISKSSASGNRPGSSVRSRDLLRWSDITSPDITSPRRVDVASPQ